MKNFRKTALACLLILALLSPAAGAFAAAGGITFHAEAYRGSAMLLPYFYTVSGGGVTITDCLKDAAGDAVLPDRIDSKPVTSIAAGAFAGCDALTSVTVPQTVTAIAEDAFPQSAGFTVYAPAESCAQEFCRTHAIPCALPTVPGDADRDGICSITDLTSVAKQLAGWNVSVSALRADYDGDLALSISDLTLLAKHLAGWSDKPTVYVLGDENAEAKTDRSLYYPAAGYSAFLSRELSAHAFADLSLPEASAKSFVSTENYLALWNTVSAGDTVLISFGTHDGDSVRARYAPAEGGAQSADSFAWSLNEYYVKPLRARGAVPVLVTPVVSRPLDGETFTTACLKGGYPEATRTLARESDTALLDLTDASRDLYRSLGEAQNALLNARTGKELSTLLSDRLSTFGAEQIASLAARGLRTALGFTDPARETETAAAFAAATEATESPTVFTYSDGTTEEVRDTLITAASRHTPRGAYLTAVQLAGGVSAIAPGAFRDEYELSWVSMPSTLVSIGESAFENCNRLSLSEWDAPIEEIGASAFYGCESISICTLPETLTTLGDYAFYGCDSILSVSVPTSLGALPDGAFGGCASLEEVSFSDYLTDIGARAFDRCRKLSRLNIPADLAVIGRRAFSATALTSLRLPTSMAAIGAEAFCDCAALTELTFPAVATEWVKVQKGENWWFDSGLELVNCEDGEVTLDDIILVDYHAYYSDFFTAFADANAFSTEHKDLDRYTRENAEAAILIENGVLTLKLMEDLTLAQELTLSEDLTLDLCGYSVRCTDASAAFALAKDTAVTLADSVGGGQITKTFSSDSALYLFNLPNTGASLTLTGGRLSCTNSGKGSSIAIRGTGAANTAFTMEGGSILAAVTASSTGNAKAIQSPAVTLISGGAVASKAYSKNSYALSGTGKFTVTGGTFDSYTHNGNSSAFYAGSGTTATDVEITDGVFITHATGYDGTHSAFQTAPGTTAVIRGGTFTTDSRKTGDHGAVGMLISGKDTVIYSAYVQGNNTGLESIGRDITIYGGTFVGADHGGAYFTHSDTAVSGTVAIFGGTFRCVVPDWQLSTSGTGSAYFNGGGTVYINGADFEGNQVTVSADGGSSPATTLFVSNTTAPEWRVDSKHTVWFGKGMTGASITEDSAGTVNFTKYANTVFDEAYVAANAG